MVTVRRFRDEDAGVLWALNALPNIGDTADLAVPIPLPALAEPPAEFPDLADVEATFLARGGEFLVVELDGHLAGMGGYRPGTDGTAEVLRVRVHPATRRRGIGRALMGELERRAARAGLTSLHLDTATNQPPAMAFYRALGYREAGREHQAGWTWTLVYYVKELAPSVHLILS
ncbi:GNAT family N-acetyltransferase [Paractinoplanes atraurantiacus]|uniref:Acetyltransferase (GNAT) family protein n=1 Tax=Paractinoplanes atraurantiacus TaxID=1036182 RepID=A0A285IEW1_9ACTN|nr:GNAT family N-acetyltransferase [Actinoplanes atraurantiacus]SNY45606.1 Acetyltransferase (GNAT) family protein [Actinoplanes atraurantiacus]